MKLPVFATAALCLLILPTINAQAMKLNTETDKVSYTIGVDLGKNLKKQSVKINVEALAKGINDAQAGTPLLLTEPQMRETLKKFQTQLLAKKAQAFKNSAKTNLDKGQKFLAENKKNAGVVTTASGLQYKIITKGNGKMPTVNDKVTVKYTGKLIDGTVFDSTEKTGKPVSFKVNEVIPGWTEALQLMHAGATWEIYVPSELAYGKRGVGGPIGPNETLIFNIQLISVDAMDASAQKKSNS